MRDWGRFWMHAVPMMVVGALLTGCATNLSKPAGPPAATKVKFGEFKKVEMAKVTVSEKFAAAGANQKAARKIDEILKRDMAMLFPGMALVDTVSKSTNAAERTLQIIPHIKEIKFIGGGARFMVGAMAGSSAVLMQVTFKDSSTGEVVADPEFYRAAGSMSGGYSIGGTDNLMLDNIVKDITNYTLLNR